MGERQRRRQVQERTEEEGRQEEDSTGKVVEEEKVEEDAARQRRRVARRSRTSAQRILSQPSSRHQGQPETRPSREGEVHGRSYLGVCSNNLSHVVGNLLRGDARFRVHVLVEGLDGPSEGRGGVLVQRRHRNPRCKHAVVRIICR